MGAGESPFSVMSVNQCLLALLALLASLLASLLAEGQDWVGHGQQLVPFHQ